MKNLLVVLIFSLMSSVAFAETNYDSDKSVNVNSEQEVPVASTPDFSVESSDELVADNTGDAKDCTLKGKFTLIFPDGSTYSWEGTLTIVGVSCVEFLKEMMAQ